MSGYIVNPEAVGNPDETPILQTDPGCPAHSDDWLYRAVRTNRRLSGLPAQECTCDETCAHTYARAVYGDWHECPECGGRFRGPVDKGDR